MSKKVNCMHAIFDNFWKKHKCTIYQHVLFEPDTCNGCVRYREKENNNEKTDTNKI